jgi:hypothetical protein
LRGRLLPVDVRSVMLYCAPTILGVTGVIVAELFRPGTRMPLESFADQMFVGLFTFGAPIALIGVPWVALAAIGAVRIVRTHGALSSKGQAVVVTVALGIAAATYLIAQMRQALETQRQ